MLNRILFKIFGVRLISSQCGEDLIIESLLLFKNKGFYVDIGANHPIKFNNTFLFHSKGWRGINVEPNPSKRWLFKIFRRKDTNLCVGIGQNKSEMNFYIFDESTLSTFDKSSADEFEKIGHKIKSTIKVPIIPLRDVLSDHAKEVEIDILSIDTEGFDMEVLKSNDWSKYRPHFIIIETLEYRSKGSGSKLNPIFDPYMDSIGYRKIADTYINTIYEKNY
jgi:FkbM family methyltransferase